MSLTSNKFFCALPFTYVYVDSLNEYKLCSDARLSSQINTNDQSIIEYFNSDYLNEIRFDMLRSDISEQIRGTCIRCIEREELGLWSRREKNIDYKIIKDYINNKKLTPTAQTLKLKFGNLCNLKCLTCGPYSSSRWAHERNESQELTVFRELKDSISQASFKKYGKLYQNTFDHEFVLDTKNLTYNFSDEIYNELKSIIPNLKFIIISGGEPFINDEFYEFIQWLITNKYSYNINLIVFSNMTKLLKNYKVIYDKFKSVTINVSIDGIYKKDEYIRHGTNFAEKKKNIEQLLPYFKLSFCATMSILNVGYQSDLIEFCSQYRKYPSFFNVLVEPFYLQINNLPEDIIEIYKKKNQNHKLFNSPLREVTHFKLGISYLKKYDKIHNTNLLEEWPEFERYYND
tara:strand:- start:2048 stop:3253 length:1206 start_codon:yes stop_codon:yes gene_type:complete